MLDLPGAWVWDFWLAHDGDRHHLFFLQAPRTLAHADLRHVNASVGHAVSTDLTTWTLVSDAIHPSPAPAFDDLSTWTGCVVRGDDGLWRMFSSGIAHAENGLVQRVGVSTSADLVAWRRSKQPVVEADPRWYAKQRGDRPEHWRDPWVVRDGAGTWHMYLTAAVPEGVGTGVVGHAVSTDLERWQVAAPLSRATGRFDQLEVIQVVEVEGRWVALFSCLGGEMPGAPEGAGGIWSVPVRGPGARVDVAAAVRLTSERLYVGKVVAASNGAVRFLAFVNQGEDGAFVGGVTDPLPVGWRPDGSGLTLFGDNAGWLP